MTYSQQIKERIVLRKPSPMALRVSDRSDQEYEHRTNVARNKLREAHTFSGYVFSAGSLLPETRNILRKLHESEPGDIHYGDAGCGLGEGLVEAKQISPKIKATGITLGKAKGVKAYDALIRKPFESFTVPGHFHVLQSAYSLMHAYNSAIALENLLNSLRDGGKLVIKSGLDSDLPTTSSIKEKLVEQGFTVSPGSFNTVVITRNRGQIADLSLFYQDRRINIQPVKQHKKTS